MRLDIIPAGSSSLAKKYALVVSLDFGTAMSGYAFAWTADPSKAIYHSQWSENYIKTPTALLIDKKDLKFKSFGEDAISQFRKLDPEDSSSVLFFERFKLSLFESTPDSKRGEVKAANGDQRVPVLPLIVYSLKELSAKALNVINNGTTNNITKDMILWVVTVPAIWDTPARETMNEAAKLAGLASKDLENILICLEPEAASIDCISKFQLKLPVGTKLMIIDAGGGTIDITCHQLENNNQLKEIIPAKGISWGSTRSNELYEKFLFDLFTPFVRPEELTECFHSNDFTSVKASFETAKRTFKPIDDTVVLEIQDMCAIFGEPRIKQAIDSYNRQHLLNDNDKIKYFRTRLRMSPALFSKLFFDPLFSIIKKHLDELFSQFRRELDGLKEVFLVGGFAQSEILQSFLKTNYGHNFNVRVPVNPGSSVLCGAVYFGLNPSTIKSRIARFTIGIETRALFIPAVHPQAKRSVIDGVSYCDSVFDKFVKVGDTLSEDTCIKRAYTPNSTSQSTIHLFLYYSTKETPMFVTDADVHPLGLIEFNLPDPGYPNNARIIDVTMKFGANKFEVEAVYRRDGSRISHNLKFPLSETEAKMEMDEKVKERINAIKKGIEQNKNQKHANIVELAFCLDGTGSMDKWILEVTKKIREIADIFRNKYRDMILRVGIVTYRDLRDVDPPHFEIKDFTEDIADLKAFVSKLVAGGGGDLPEDVLGGLEKICALSWTDDSIRVLVHIGDAPPHGQIFFPGEDFYKEGTGVDHRVLLKKIRKMNIDYNFVKINFLTDTMISEFRKDYDDHLKNIKVYDLGDSVNQLTPSVISSVITSVSRFIE